jgi:hypothetical protein
MPTTRRTPGPPTPLITQQPQVAPAPNTNTAPMAPIPNVAHVAPIPNVAPLAPTSIHDPLSLVAACASDAAGNKLSNEADAAYYVARAKERLARWPAHGLLGASSSVDVADDHRRQLASRLKTTSSRSTVDASPPVPSVAWSALSRSLVTLRKVGSLLAALPPPRAAAAAPPPPSLGSRLLCLAGLSCYQ